MLPLRLPWTQAQDRWATIINPVLDNPNSNGLLLSNVTLKSGTNIINHTLGRQQQGWYVTDINSAAQIYRSTPLNSLTLTLFSSAPCVVGLWVF